MNQTRVGHTEKVTPGPWTFVEYDDGDAAIVGPEGDERIAEMATNVTDAERDANARLIAAAPDLLEALKLLRTEVTVSGNWGARDYGWPAAREAVDAAILKAEGETR